eukprot:g40150.t1
MCAIMVTTCVTQCSHGHFCLFPVLFQSRAIQKGIYPGKKQGTLNRANLEKIAYARITMASETTSLRAKTRGCHHVRERKRRNIIVYILLLISFTVVVQGDNRYLPGDSLLLNRSSPSQYPSRLTDFYEAQKAAPRSSGPPIAATWATRNLFQPQWAQLRETFRTRYRHIKFTFIWSTGHCGTNSLSAIMKAGKTDFVGFNEQYMGSKVKMRKKKKKVIVVEKVEGQSLLWGFYNNQDSDAMIEYVGNKMDWIEYYLHNERETSVDIQQVKFYFEAGHHVIWGELAVWAGLLDPSQLTVVRLRRHRYEVMRSFRGQPLVCHGRNNAREYGVYFCPPDPGLLSQDLNFQNWQHLPHEHRVLWYIDEVERQWRHLLPTLPNITVLDVSWSNEAEDPGSPWNSYAQVVEALARHSRWRYGTMYKRNQHARSALPLAVSEVDLDLGYRQVLYGKAVVDAHPLSDHAFWFAKGIVHFPTPFLQIHPGPPLRWSLLEVPVIDATWNASHSYHSTNDTDKAHKAAVASKDDHGLSPEELRLEMLDFVKNEHKLKRWNRMAKQASQPGVSGLPATRLRPFCTTNSCSRPGQPCGTPLVAAVHDTAQSSNFLHGRANTPESTLAFSLYAFVSIINSPRPIKLCGSSVGNSYQVMAQRARQQPEQAEEPVGEPAQAQPVQDPEECRSEVSLYRYHSALKHEQIPDYRLAIYPDNSVRLFRLMDNLVKISAYYNLEPLTIYKDYFRTEEAKQA